mmetsp:Transcript_25010/g.29555  ORF Transcript_25010/g.29555 Transcript_25010/m.29555 type:complete len:1010 (+) Transcript_25010:61-3090(+)
MPLRLEIKKMLQSRSDRVKCVDIHPSENWVLSALYNGKVFLWDYENGTMVKSFDICDLPVRSAKFIERKQWFITASDDMMIRVFNYNTMEKVQEFEAHTDYIRYLEVHPSLPYVISAADDMSMKLWNWDKNWENTQLFEGHAHYVMMVKFNLKDTNTFASASLDRSIKVWGLGAVAPHFSLEGHERGVNCIDYYPGGDKPYLLSGADDKTVKIWDYQTKSCVVTLDGHANNVCAVQFHPRLPLLLSGSEDGTVRIWHSTTYRAETTLNYGMERAWSLSCTHDANKVAIGYDEGTVVLKLGHEAPVVSLDQATSKIVWAINNDIQTANLKGSGAMIESEGISDGERVSVSHKELGSTEVYPQSVKHNNNGRFIVVCGDGEYIIYTSQALRNKAFGSAIDFCWSATATGDYAIRENTSRVKIFKNFKEHKSVKAGQAEGIFGGHCLGVKGQESVSFFDWGDGHFIRKIDVVPTEVLWNEAGTLVCLICDDTSYVLKYDDNAVTTAIQSGNIPDDGVEGAFDFANEINDKVKTGQWVGDCLIFTNSGNRLNYFVGGEVITLAHLDHTMYMLGYLPKEDRVYLVDNARNVVSYRILTSVLQFQTAVVRGDMNDANELIKNVPESEHSTVARFLESQGLKNEALAITKDPDQKFDLALELEKLEIGASLMEQVKEQDKDTTDVISKWKRLGDLALSKGDLKLATKCAQSAGDMSGILLLATSIGDADAMTALTTQARELGKTNVAFISMFLLGNVEGCVDLLVDTGRIPEAAFMARTYMPSLMSKLVTVWKEDLATVSTRAAQALADPNDFPNLFPDLDVAIQVEEYFTANRGALPPAGSYPQASQELNLDLISLFKEKSKAMKAQAEAQKAQEASKAAAQAAQAAPAAPPPVAKKEESPSPASPVAAPTPPSTSEENVAKTEAQDNAKAEAEAKAKAEAEARAKAEVEAAKAKAKAEAEARAKAEVEAAKAKAEAEAAAAKKKAEEEAAAKAAEEAAKLEDDILGDDDLGDDW